MGNVFFRGETIRVSCEIRDSAGVLTNPTSAAVSVYNHLGTKVISSAALAQDVTGKYSGSFAAASTWIRGDYRVIFEIVVPTALNVYEEAWFTLEVLPE